MVWQPIQPSGKSCLALACGTFKDFGGIGECLAAPTKRKAAVSHAPDTPAKAMFTVLTGILLDSGLDAAREFLGEVIGAFHATLEVIMAAPDPLAALASALEATRPENAKEILSVHRTTVDALQAGQTRADLDEMLVGNYRACMAELGGMRAKSNQVILAIDDTHQRATSKHLNDNYSWATQGGRRTWERAFKFQGIYDCTSQLYAGCTHVDYHRVRRQGKDLRPWIGDIARAVSTVRGAGSRVALVEADREYFVAEFFASATLGLLDPGAPAREQPRLVVPRKFTREKDTFKWDYLLGDELPEVFVDYLALDPYAFPALKFACTGSFGKNEKGRFLVPYACVALVDEYDRKKARSLAEARAEAREIQENLESCAGALQAAREAYTAYRKKAAPGKSSNPPSGRGMLRKRWVDDQDKRLYKECLRLLGETKRWKERKRTLLNALMFAAVSLRPGEDPTRHPKMFAAIARDYHERWGIENGFRDTKRDFLRPTRSRKPTRRQLVFVLGFMLYNAWHVGRMRRMLELYREPAWNKVPWDPRRPHVRRKLEREFGGTLSAGSFLARLWGQGVKILMQKKLKRVPSNS